MPRRNDIQKVMIIGSGPIVIGQACEFDYSGTQACRALHSLGYEVVVVNSNPATIMTDPGMADVTYIEPLTHDTLAQIIERERPDAVLPNVGGQTALNLCSQLVRSGVLERFGVKVIGVGAEAIERAEDRILLKKMMEKLGIPIPRSEAVQSVEQAEAEAEKLGYPVVIRPAYTLGGIGGGLVYNIEELRSVAARGLSASLVKQVLVQESMVGWGELEVEVIRDGNNRKIAVCFIENLDGMGVHTGDSVCVVPMQTISREVQQRLQKYACEVADELQVVGGTNVQFAHDPATDRVLVMEVNPRMSRSSALASKAMGLPMAFVASLLAGGLGLDEIPYWREGTLDRYTPSGDQVVVKYPRWAFEKFEGVEDRLGTQMRSVGEVAGIGHSYKEALQKAVQSLEIGRCGLGFAKDFVSLPLKELLRRLWTPSSERQFLIYEALRKGASAAELNRITQIKPWFIEQMKELVELEEKILACRGRELPDALLGEAKRAGFADRYLAQLLEIPETQIRGRRNAIGVRPGWDAIRVSGGAGNVSYCYSTCNAADSVKTDSRPKVMILGSGPNRIGQGIELDYSCVHAAAALRKAGYETILVNSNPETVSTDYDASDRLYFDPLTTEHVLAICEKERPVGVIVQFGGDAPRAIARELNDAGVPVLGTALEILELAEKRHHLRQVLSRLGLPGPDSGLAGTLGEALPLAAAIGYPLMVRQSNVPGGAAAKIILDEAMLREYIDAVGNFSAERPVFIERFLENAVEAEADAISDGTDAFIPAVMEHVEYAGTHSGDAACVIPPVAIPEDQIRTIEAYTRKIALELKSVGLLNVRYAISNGTVYVLETSPWASRTIPLISKVCGIPMAGLAARVIMGTTIPELALQRPKLSFFGAKEAVFPFGTFTEVDPVLGPDMRSTGEVLGLADSFGLAFFKSQEAAGEALPLQGTVLMTIADRDKHDVITSARRFREMGFRIVASQGTRRFLAQHGIDADLIWKMHEGRPHIVDAIKSGEIHLIINTPHGRVSEVDDSDIRKMAVRYRVPYITTAAAAQAAATGIEARRPHPSPIHPLGDWGRT